jgi:hypothetical protein
MERYRHFRRYRCVMRLQLGKETPSFKVFAEDFYKAHATYCMSKELPTSTAPFLLTTSGRSTVGVNTAEISRPTSAQRVTLPTLDGIFIFEYSIFMFDYCSARQVEWEINVFPFHFF